MMMTMVRNYLSSSGKYSLSLVKETQLRLGFFMPIFLINIVYD